MKQNPIKPNLIQDQVGTQKKNQYANYMNIFAMEPQNCRPHTILQRSGVDLPHKFIPIRHTVETVEKASFQKLILEEWDRYIEKCFVIIFQTEYWRFMSRF